ncbi:MAG: hypothetical protein ABIU29_07435, partial [Chthoniobacterales bacterium]
GDSPISFAFVSQNKRKSPSLPRAGSPQEELLPVATALIAIEAGKNGATGVGLVEAYRRPYCAGAFLSQSERFYCY